jgi:predicted RNA-binding Zn-ribbon protein involved in translation (DUF1610 family)
MSEAPRRVEPEKWYIAVDCAKCGDGIAIAEAPSPDEKPDPLQHLKIEGVTCPHCGHVDMYAPALMSRRQGPERKPASGGAQLILNRRRGRR